MKLTITQPHQVDAKLLKVFCGDRLECEEFVINGGKAIYDGLADFLEAYPSLRGEPNKSNELMLIIDVETGLVRNWPQNSACDFHDIKIVDTGTYILYDDRGEVICEDDGYVPECLGRDGYGDYFEFSIDETSHIVDWNFGQDDLDEMQGLV